MQLREMRLNNPHLSNLSSTTTVTAGAGCGANARKQRTLSDSCYHYGRQPLQQQYSIQNDSAVLSDNSSYYGGGGGGGGLHQAHSDDSASVPGCSSGGSASYFRQNSYQRYQYQQQQQQRYFDDISLSSTSTTNCLDSPMLRSATAQQSGREGVEGGVKKKTKPSSHGRRRPFFVRMTGLGKFRSQLSS